MKTIRLILHISIIQLVFICSTYGQIFFDVKTLMQEKSQLKFVKLAVINNLENSNWAKVVEVGENYSLWLTGLKRNIIGDSIHSEFDIDLRTAAFITQGKHILSKHISIVYDTTGISKINSSNDTLLTHMIIQGFQSTEVYSDMLKLFSSSIPLGNMFFQIFADKFFNEYKRVPTPLEQFEANLLAAKVEIELYNIFKNTKH